MVVKGSLRSSLKEVLSRFLRGVVCAVEEVVEVGKRQGRKNRRRASILVIVTGC